MHRHEMSEHLHLKHVLLDELVHLEGWSEIEKITHPYDFIKNLLLTAEQEPSQSKPPTKEQLLHGLLSPDTKLLLEGFGGSDKQDEEIVKALVKYLNQLVRENDLRSSKLYMKTLDDLAKSLFDQYPHGVVLPYLNRLILTKIFPDDLSWKIVEPIVADAVPDQNKIYEAIHRLPQGRSALCLSGGGIRSATFALGLIQTLAGLRLQESGLPERKLLEQFDYLSTVSGGGYIGSWLSAWIYREAKTANGCTLALKNIMDAVTKKTVTKKTGNSLESDADQITFLRRYRNYLSPNWSAFSADTWTLIATYLRNLFLNWLVIVPALLGVLALPRIDVYLVTLKDWHQILSSEVFLVFGTGFTIWSIAAITAQMVQTQSPSTEAGVSKGCQASFRRACLYPLLVAAVLLAIYWAHPESSDKVLLRGVLLWSHEWILSILHTISNSIGVDLTQSSRAQMIEFVIFATSVHIAGVLLGIIYRLIRKSRGNASPVTAPLPGASKAKNIFRVGAVVGLALVAASTASGLAAWAVATELFDDPKSNPHLYVTLAAPLLLLIFLLAGDLLIGLLARWKSDEHREWKARLNAYVLMTCVVWVLGSTLVLYGPRWLAEFPYPALLSSFGGVSGLLAILLGFSPKTQATPTVGKNESAVNTARRWALSTTAPLGVIFVIVFLSWWTSAMVLKWDTSSTFDHAREQTSSLQDWPYYRLVAHIHQLIVQETSGITLLVFIGACVIVSIVMAWFVDINKFSLHALYRNCLIRTFLGASHVRNPDCFTDFDPEDNVEMCELSKTTCRPFHVINIALNLLNTNNLAWRSRKAASFTITPLHAGSAVDQLGYRRSGDFGRRNDSRGQSITLGTALAISGAAASPNMGYHSSPAVTFLLSLFNVRLGWWLGNPGKAGDDTTNWKRASPRSALWWWMKEALGDTREDDAYVYLSDGGHFENLGLYEMVLRRCRFIVVSDAGCDPTYSFEDLGNAIRKIRVDLGIDIEIDLDMLRPQASQRYSRWHQAIGTIRYDKVDKDAPVGILLYIKASLTGDEPADVLEYAGSHPVFPHQSTGDQFFDEAQFESYRALGEHIASEVFRPAQSKTKIMDVFQALRSHWVTLPPTIEASFLKQNEAFVQLEARLRDDKNLESYDQEIYPELVTILGADARTSSTNDCRAVLHFCMKQIQLMEDVFLALKLNTYHVHPLNRGWMNFFRRLTATSTFRLLWPSLRNSFSRDFVEFAEYHLNLSSVPLQRISEGLPPEKAMSTLMDEFKQEWPVLETQTEKQKEFLTDLQNQISTILLTANDQRVILFKASPKEGKTPDEEVWGVAGATINTNTNNKSIDLLVWVRGAHRGAGIGRMLLSKLLKKLKTDYPGYTASVTLPALRKEHLGYQFEKSAWLRFYEREEFVLKEETPEMYRLTRELPDQT